MIEDKELPAEQISHLISSEFAGSSSSASIETVASLHVMVARLIDAITALARLQSRDPTVSEAALSQFDRSVTSLLNELSENIKRLANEKIDGGAK